MKWRYSRRMTRVRCILVETTVPFRIRPRIETRPVKGHFLSAGGISPSASRPLPHSVCCSAPVSQHATTGSPFWRVPPPHQKTSSSIFSSTPSRRPLPRRGGGFRKNTLCLLETSTSSRPPADTGKNRPVVVVASRTDVLSLDCSLGGAETQADILVVATAALARARRLDLGLGVEEDVRLLLERTLRLHSQFGRHLCGRLGFIARLRRPRELWECWRGGTKG